MGRGWGAEADLRVVERLAVVEGDRLLDGVDRVVVEERTGVRRLDHGGVLNRAVGDAVSCRWSGRVGAALEAAVLGMTPGAIRLAGWSGSLDADVKLRLVPSTPRAPPLPWQRLHLPAATVPPAELW